MNSRPRELFKNKLAVLVSFTGISLIIFSSSTGRIFLSDDYCTMDYLISHDSVLLPSFFRPVGDLMLKLTYLLVGWEPFYFYLGNIIIHAANSFLVYMFCRKWLSNKGSDVFAILSGLIFLTYPSHSEAIMWAIGRGISLAVFFSLLAMISLISNIKLRPRYLIVCFFYFIAMACYESAILLPFILFTLMQPGLRRQHTIWSVLLLFTLFLHLLLRYYFTGGIWEAYNGIVFSHDLVQYFSSFAKILLRIFIPPFNQPLLFTICGVAAIGLLFLVFSMNRKRIEKDPFFIRTIYLVLTGLLATIVIAVFFGVSTRTSEGDRLMYFPSVFYSILMALLIVRLADSSAKIIIVSCILFAFQVTFLLINQNHWIRASSFAVKIINGVASHPERPLYVINLPSDYKGAYIFRNCLDQALKQYRIDPSGVHIVNVILSDEMEKRRDRIAPEKQGNNIFIWPKTVLGTDGNRVQSILTDTTINVNVPLSAILYWDREELLRLNK